MIIWHFIVLELWIIFHSDKSQTMLKGQLFLFSSWMFLRVSCSKDLVPSLLYYRKHWNLQEVVPKKSQAIIGIHLKVVFTPWTIHQSVLSSYYLASVWVPWNWSYWSWAQGQQNQVLWYFYRPETCKSISQNKCFFFKFDLAQRFCCSNAKLT